MSPRVLDLLRSMDLFADLPDEELAKIARQTAMNTRLTQEVGATTGDVRGQVTVVFSPRGGAGQTILTTNLAVALAELTPDRVAILDLDLLFGHVSMLLDLVPRTALAAISPAAIRG